MKERILVIDDEANIAWLFREVFGNSYEVISAETGEEGLKMANTLDLHLIMLDLRLPDISGLEVLEQLNSHGYNGRVIIMTAYGEVKTAVRAMKSGAHDYITKPFDIDELKLLVEGALNYSRLASEVTRLRRELEDKFHLRNIVTVSPKMLQLFSIVERVSSSDVPILILGESGTGKEIFARAIHHASPRKDRPFVPVNCAALPENLLESELFGFEEGAFSGARRRKPGKFELAQGGTLFLDEVGELPLAMQPKILRALEEKEIDRLGGTERLPVDVRIVAASNKNIPAEVRTGRFRQDLYFRLAVIPIVIPPLRERKEDIPVLARHFLRQFALEQKRAVPRLDEEAIGTLISYPWPGNVRELKNAMHQVSIMCDSHVIRKRDLPWLFYDSEWHLPGLRQEEGSRQSCSTGQQINGLAPLDEMGLKELRQLAWNQIEIDRIKKALDLHNQNRTHTARYLGISRRTLQTKIKKYGI
ncbi:MAG: sigma-54-dependent transcriptional regulator [Bacillota bacterium]|jgi:DNA-binding NtrC family response regulator